MRKRMIFAVAALVLTAGICSTAMAAEKEGATSKSLKSHGSIVYEDADSEVEINSLDLYMLADQIDQIRVNVANQLRSLHTYFTTGKGVALKTDGRIGITHTAPSGKNYVDPLTIDFDTLLEGIAASQWVPTDVKDYGYSDGTRLYRKADGSLTTYGSGDDLTEIRIREATADNLSAGTAAWVNGRLLLGTGKDNSSYMEKGQDSASGDDTGGMGSSLFDFYEVEGWMGGFHGEIPYSFTPGKSLLILIDGPLDPVFDGANLPDASMTKRECSMFYWENNPHSAIKVKIPDGVGGANANMLIKEW